MVIMRHVGDIEVLVTMDVVYVYFEQCEYAGTAVQVMITTHCSCVMRTAYNDMNIVLSTRSEMMI